MREADAAPAIGTRGVHRSAVLQVHDHAAPAHRHHRRARCVEDVARLMDDDVLQHDVAAIARGALGEHGRRVVQRQRLARAHRRTVLARRDLAIQRVEPALHLDREPGRGGDSSRFAGTHGEGVAVPLVAVPEHLRRDGEVEGDHRGNRESDYTVGPGYGRLLRRHTCGD